MHAGRCVAGDIVSLGRSVGLKTADFCYELPEVLIAQRPLPARSAGRLLCVEGRTGVICHRRFVDLIEYLRPNDLLVVNDTRVIRARLTGKKTSGGRVEVLVERVLGDNRMRAQIRASKAPKRGTTIQLDDGPRVRVHDREGAFFVLDLPPEHSVAEWLGRVGHVPLPPYIERPDDMDDAERYQTVYAAKPGAVAAPTAGLHFDQAMLERLTRYGVELACVTLHVGAGSFAPVRVESVEAHAMHEERVQVDATVCEQVARVRRRGGRVVAVGTTVVRAMETAAQGGALAPYSGETALFIYPGFPFRVVDALLTNFHQPRSTLLMLVTAFGGYDLVMAAYRQAIAERYRFLSYGDAMYVTRVAP